LFQRELPEKMKRFSKELAAFLRELPRMLEEGDEGRYAVVCGDEILQTWDSYRDATQYALERCGDRPFLAQKISRVQLERWDNYLREIRERSGGAACPS
jgi:hypothetical protein